ncbi:hypothetical protein R69919_00862 [Paraburkholderia gardini]|nr:hypothetical protein R69919_00862 [Paraburkholderia gardini]
MPGLPAIRQANISAAQAILLGDADVAPGGGAENMSRAPYITPDTRFGVRMGNAHLIDMMPGVLNDHHEDHDDGELGQRQKSQQARSRAGAKTSIDDVLVFIHVAVMAGGDGRRHRFPWMIRGVDRQSSIASWTATAPRFQ